MVEVYGPVFLGWVAGSGQGGQVGSVQVGPAVAERVNALFVWRRHNYHSGVLGCVWKLGICPFIDGTFASLWKGNDALKRVKVEVEVEVGSLNRRHFVDTHDCKTISHHFISAH